MANKRKEVEFINTDDFISILAERARFAKKDVKEILDEIRVLFEECVRKGVDIDLKGILHMSIIDIEYKKRPGIVKYHGGKNFNKTAKKIIFSAPENLRNIARGASKSKNEEEGDY